MVDHVIIILVSAKPKSLLRSSLWHHNASQTLYFLVKNSFFITNLCPKTHLYQTEEWDFEEHFFFCRLFILGVNENSNSTSTTDLQWDRVSDTSHWHQEQSSQWENFDQSEWGQETNQPIRNRWSRCVASVWVISSISGIKSKNQWRHAPSWHRHLFPNIWYSMIEWDVWALGLVTVAVLCWLLPYYTWFWITFYLRQYAWKESIKESFRQIYELVAFVCVRGLAHFKYQAGQRMARASPVLSIW